MKFVIKSLLFVNLLLQMTSSLRKCFNQDQNLMLTIILLAFSLIGIIGLTVGNRFILIIFAACMTLILIASITIYAIGRTEQDASKPKVPYFTNIAQSELASAERGNRIKSFVNKLFNRSQQMDQAKSISSSSSSSSSKRTRKLPQRLPSANSDSVTRGLRNQFATGKRLPPPVSLPLPLATEDYSDEPGGVVHLLLSSHQVESPALARAGFVGPDEAKPVDAVASAKATIESGQRKSQDDDVATDQDLDESNMVTSQQWIAYERRLYEHYLDMVSQSIDLILLTILASWMALLLDEDSDQCFGNASSEPKHGSGQPSKHEAPIYNYNGVRYSIKPDEVADSPSRVVVR